MIRTTEVNFHQLSDGRYVVGTHEPVEWGWHQTAELYFVSLVCTRCLNFSYGYSQLALADAVASAAVNLDVLPCISGVGQWVAPMLERRRG